MSKIRLNKDHLKDIDYKVTVPMIQCSECGQSVLDTPTNRANNLIHDAMCSKNSTPQPLGMSGDEEWWNKPEYKCVEPNLKILEWDVKAIIAEARRLAIDELDTIVREEAKAYFDRKNGTVRTPYDNLIKRLKSL